MAQAWFQYTIDTPGSSYGQITDPLGNYKKPDVNIAVPSGTPITSLTDGVVTDVSDHGLSGGGLSVVIRMTTPLNSLATHAAYNFLGSTSVRVGQSVTMGQQIGTAGSPYGIYTAVGLTPDNTWGNGSFYLNAQGNPLLDPHLLLDGAPSSGISNLGGVFGPVFISVSNKAQEFLNNVPGFEGLCYALDAVEQYVPFVMKTSSGQDVGILGSIPVIGGIATSASDIATLPSDAIQALLTFITANLTAWLVRLFLFIVGLVILITLIYNAVMYVSNTGAGPGIQGAANMAAFALDL